MVERRCGGLRADLLELFAFVLTAVGDRRVRGVRDLEHEGAERAVDRLLLGFLRAQLFLQRTRRRDLHRPLVGRCLPDRLGRRVLTGAQRVDVLDERAPHLVEREHFVDEPGAHPLALDPAPVLRFLAEPLDVDHACSPSRICARSCSTHVDACFHARPAARRRSTPASIGPPTG